MAGLGYLVVLRADQFLADWPRYSAALRHVTTAFDRQIATVEKGVDAISPVPDKGKTPVRPAEAPPVREWLLRGVGSLYSILLGATFVPFLVFFMLAAKQRIWKATIELFPDDDRDRVREALNELSSMMRRIVAGNALIAIILMLASWGFFLLMHLKYPFLLGSVSGVLNLVPYLGALLAWIPPFLIGLAQWSTVGPYLLVAAVLSSFHIVGMNILMPAIVRAQGALECAGGHRSAAFLGMAVGRGRFDPGHSDHRHGESELRSFRRLGTTGSLAGRVGSAWFTVRKRPAIMH
jgi:predicted PurR-regulated permease PerM